MKKTSGRTKAVAALAGLALTATIVSVPVAVAEAKGRGELKVTGLASSGTKLVRFDTARPWALGWANRISGLQGDQKLVGIDYRVQNGQLYGVGNSGGVYLIKSKGQATKVGQLSVALAGTDFGVDFNPAANALRVVSDTGQNLRQPFGTGDAPNGLTVADTALTNAGAPATGVSGAAYTNNDLSADTATSLFDIDTTLDQVSLQSPANSGTLAPTGKLGVDAQANAGFDIYSTVRNGKTVADRGFATVSVSGKYSLYSVDLLTGAVDRRGGFPIAITDIAIPLAQR